MTTEEHVAQLTRVVRELVELLDGGPTGLGPVLSADPTTREMLGRMRFELKALEQQQDTGDSP